MDSPDKKPGAPSGPRPVRGIRILKRPTALQTIVALALLVFFLILFIVVFLY